MNKKLFLWSITAALAGFLFGFDTIVISGVESKLQTLWQTSDNFHGWVVVAMALWGTVIGAFFGNIPTNKIGRKNTLFLIGILYTISAFGSALAFDPFSFALFRFIGGVGIGVSTVAAPTYISEISTPQNRGQLGSMYQFNIVLGILVAFLSNYLLNDLGENAWRFMVGVEGIPAILYTVFVLFINKSPRWLVSKSRIKEAKTVLKAIDKDCDVNAKISEIRQTTDMVSMLKESIFTKKYTFPLMLAFFIAFFNQFSGINAFLYYAPRIFAEAGLGESAALFSSIGIGVVNLLFTFLGVMLIDKLGRKTLMYIGSFGYIVSLSLVGSAFLLDWPGSIVPWFLFLFIAAHAIGQGTVIWVFISEIFPNHLRANGQAFGSTIHWIFAAIIPGAIPYLFSIVGTGIVFLFFTFMMILQLIFVKYFMPETKGYSLEEINKRLVK